MVARDTASYGHSLGAIFRVRLPPVSPSIADNGATPEDSRSRWQAGGFLPRGAMRVLARPPSPIMLFSAAEAAEGEICQAATTTTPTARSVSGAKAAVQRAVEIAKTRGAKRAGAIS